MNRQERISKESGQPNAGGQPNAWGTSGMKELVSQPDGKLDAAWLRELAMTCGADDVGFVSMDRAELDDQREDI